MQGRLLRPTRVPTSRPPALLEIDFISKRE